MFSKNKKAKKSNPNNFIGRITAIIPKKYLLLEMNPDYDCCCEKNGMVDMGNGTSLYFELRGNEKDPKVVLIMGAFATCKHFTELADKLAKRGFHVLTYDHRGIGKSRVLDNSAPQTSELLADDCIAVVDDVFPDHHVHVYGASMGGCVAQRVALILHAQKRLLSLFLAVTSPGSYWRIPIPQFLLAFTLRSFIVPADPQAMISSLLPRCFDQKFLSQRDSNGVTMYDRWLDKWTTEYKEWFAFHNVEICASQSSVFTSHYVSPEEFAPLVASPPSTSLSEPVDDDEGLSPSVPITVYIAEKDDLMPPAKQHELATILKAKKIVYPGAHMLGGEDYDKFVDALVDHLNYGNSADFA